MTTYYGAGTAEVLNFLGFTSSDATEVGLTDTQITDALKRAQREVDERTKTHFASGTATPDYVAVSNEKHDGQGRFDRSYYTEKYPVSISTTTVGATANPSATSITVASTSGFPSSGIIGINDNKITYTGKAGTAFTGCTGLAGTVVPNDTIVPYVVEISNDDQGTDPTWTIMTPRTDFDIELPGGRVYLYKNNVVSSIYSLDNPPRYTPNRFRISYIYGWDPDADGNVPYDITRLILMLVSRDLMQTMVRKAHMKGLNSFNPTMININNDMIEETIYRYINPLFSNIH